MTRVCARAREVVSGDSAGQSLSFETVVSKEVAKFKCEQLFDSNLNVKSAEVECRWKQRSCQRISQGGGIKEDAKNRKREERKEEEIDCGMGQRSVSTMT